MLAHRDSLGIFPRATIILLGICSDPISFERQSCCFRYIKVPVLYRSLVCSKQGLVVEPFQGYDMLGVQYVLDLCLAGLVIALCSYSAVKLSA